MDDERPKRPEQGLVEDASAPGQPPVSGDQVGTGGEHPGEMPPDRRGGEDTVPAGEDGG
jgi:hypothetical protein